MEGRDLLTRAGAGFEEEHARTRFTARHFCFVVDEEDGTLNNRGADERFLIQIDGRPLAATRFVAAHSERCKRYHAGTSERADTNWRLHVTSWPRSVGCRKSGAGIPLPSDR